MRNKGPACDLAVREFEKIASFRFTVLNQSHCRKHWIIWCCISILNNALCKHRGSEPAAPLWHNGNTLNVNLLFTSVRHLQPHHTFSSSAVIFTESAAAWDIGSTVATTGGLAVSNLFVIARITAGRKWRERLHWAQGLDQSCATMWWHGRSSRSLANQIQPVRQFF